MPDLHLPTAMAPLSLHQPRAVHAIVYHDLALAMRDELTIIAGSDARYDCLVPKNVLPNIIASTLPAELAATRITLSTHLTTLSQPA